MCEDGWSGEYCHVEEETECEDGVDNDNSKSISDKINSCTRSKLHPSIDIAIKIICPSIPLSKFTVVLLIRIQEELVYMIGSLLHQHTQLIIIRRFIVVKTSGKNAYLYLLILHNYYIAVK